MLLQQTHFEIIMAKGEQFLLLQQWFQKPSAAEAPESNDLYVGKEY